VKARDGSSLSLCPLLNPSRGWASERSATGRHPTVLTGAVLALDVDVETVTQSSDEARQVSAGETGGHSALQAKGAVPG